MSKSNPFLTLLRRFGELATRSVGFYMVLFLIFVIVLGVLMYLGIIEPEHINPYNSAR